jgi:Na+-translocating ferredoxin:NAD+ oxidoreductase subunit C
LKTFSKGGIILPDNKFSANCPVETFPVPEIVKIHLSQHIGAPAIPLVQVSDRIKTGQLIAKAQDNVSANVHSSVSGTVIEISEMTNINGQKSQVIIIRSEGDTWLESIDRSGDIKNDISIPAEEIIRKIKDAGIVGLGGATFPTHLKLTYKGEKKFEILIINGAECEPYITSDHRLMLEKGKELIVGIQLLMKVLDVDKAFIGIEENKKDAIDYLTDITGSKAKIRIVSLKPKYPQGGEKQLIKAITGREIPLHKLPADMGFAVQNISTVFAIYEAVQKDKPLFERVITVSGSNIKNPSNFLVRIGTPIRELITKAGIKDESSGTIISGGPMMGKAVEDMDVPVTKGTTAVLVFARNEMRKVKPRSCIRCGKCVEVCPQGFEPYIFAILSENEDYENNEIKKINNCFECGSCTYVCPSGRPLLSFIKEGKKNVKNK